MLLLPILIAVLALPLSNAHHRGRAADEIEASVKIINDKIDEVIGPDYGKESFLMDIKKAIEEGKARSPPTYRGSHFDRYEGKATLPPTYRGRHLDRYETSPRSLQSFRSSTLDGYSGIRAGTYMSPGIIRKRSERANDLRPSFRAGGFTPEQRTLGLVSGNILPKIQSFIQNVFNIIKKIFGRMKWAFNFILKAGRAMG
ncbi:hypothetical protein WA026_002239 [Henosepilachna vigintioctopunctata]|uniref:Uncharacterized protein n=1 Tax=Henosepilachna vigintioctopunctata TaxID=420089 RepID=A0AAW1TZ71_9CUCU